MLQFRLRALLGGILCLCISFAALGYWLRRAEQQSAIVKEVISQGGSVEFATAEETSWHDRLLIAFGGESRGARVTLVALEGAAANDSLLQRVGKLHGVEILVLFHNAEITDEGMKAIAQLHQLRYLEINAPSLTSTGVAALAKCVNLKELVLTAPQVDDDAVDSLLQLPPLKRLALQTAISPAGISKIRDYQSGATIEAPPPPELETHP